MSFGELISMAHTSMCPLSLLCDHCEAVQDTQLSLQQGEEIACSASSFGYQLWNGVSKQWYTASVAVRILQQLIAGAQALMSESSLQVCGGGGPAGDGPQWALEAACSTYAVPEAAATADGQPCVCAPTTASDQGCQLFGEQVNQPVSFQNSRKTQSMNKIHISAPASITENSEPNSESQ